MPPSKSNGAQIYLWAGTCPAAILGGTYQSQSFILSKTLSETDSLIFGGVNSSALSCTQSGEISNIYLCSEEFFTGYAFHSGIQAAVLDFIICGGLAGVEMA